MRTKLIILTLSILVALPSMGKEGKDPMLIKGNITDQISGNAIEGATITIEQNGQVIQSIESDNMGNFTLKFEGAISRLDQLKVRVYKNGYRVKKIKTLREGESDMKIEMEKKAKLQPFILPSNSHFNYNI